VTGPGSANVFGGQFVAIKTAGRTIDEMIIRQPVAMKAALGENPKRVYHDKQKAPSTRMATASIFRETMVKAREYARQQENEEESDRPERDLQMEALLPVLRRELPLKIHAHRADDIVTAIRLAKEFDIDYTIEHCTEGYLIADVLKETGAKVILGPLICSRSKIELRNMRLEAPAVLAKAGIKFAIMTDHDVVPIQYLPVCAALAVREGLDSHTALEAITIEAARIVGLDDRLGSLTPGKDADVVVYDGDPLDVRSHVTHVFIDGKPVYNKEH
jgi:imidazolonepropionase-like amidohydrolase